VAKAASYTFTSGTTGRYLMGLQPNHKVHKTSEEEEEDQAHTESLRAEVELKWLELVQRTLLLCCGRGEWWFGMPLRALD
jgi:hypothetical protein